MIVDLRDLIYAGAWSFSPLGVTCFFASCAVAGPLTLHKRPMIDEKCGTRAVEYAVIIIVSSGLA